jgi:hypothetical protein
MSPSLWFYFTDLSFYTRSTLGVNEASKRQLWLIACYLAFGAGVFCRQIVVLSNFPSVNIEASRLTPSVFAGSFIVGLAIFPLVVRQVRRLADYVSDEGSNDARNKPRKKLNRGRWNMIHVLTSFTTGFFVNLAYEKVLAILRTQING